MSSGRQTGTVPKTKHNTRARRENAVNHIPNNLDWHDSFPSHRARKESNTSAPRHSDTGEEIFEENPWLGLPLTTHRPHENHQRAEDELRWSNVKSSNLTPERSSTLANVDGFISPNRSAVHHQDNVQDDRETTINKELARGRIKLRMEQSQRKIEELQQQQAALLSLRNKSIQQVKPVQIGELNQQSAPLMSLRNKVIQQVKPVQQEEIERAGNLDGRLQNMQEYANMIQVLERDESSNLDDGQAVQQLLKKMNDLFTKRVPADSLLALLESENIADGAPSLSSDDGEGAIFPRVDAGGDSEDIVRRDVTKQDNREQATAAYLHVKELKLEEVQNKLEQLQTLLTRVERLRETRPSSARVNGETGSHCSEPSVHAQVKNSPSTNGVLEKLHIKKFDLDQRKVKSNPSRSLSQATSFNQSQNENWPLPPVVNSNQVFHQNTAADYSSDEVEADYDESPVKLCPSTSQPYISPNVLLKTRSQEPVVNGSHMTGKRSAGNTTRNDNQTCGLQHSEPSNGSRQHLAHLEGSSQTNTSALALQISQLQLQMEQMQILYQNMLEKQHVSVFPTPHTCSLLPPNSMGFMQCMTPATQWHQHQLLVNSLNQCCQLIWHQQRELAGLRQALTMLQEEGSIYKCPTAGYGNNLNFDTGLLWPQHSPQTLNNQVPPGNRANNYWDNFRSYSRQNLLSGRNKSNEGSISDQVRLPRPCTENENVYSKDKSHVGRRNSVRCRQRPDGSREPNVRRIHRINASNNLKHDVTDVVSLEQSVFSELESVITESERSPEILLQLLSQLKNLKSHQQEMNSASDCDLIEQGTSVYSQTEHHRNLPPSITFNRELPKLENVLEEIGRLIQENEVCSPEVLHQIVGLIIRAFHFPPQHDAISQLEASLLRFQGSRTGQIDDELLCVIASVISSHMPFRQNNVIEELNSRLGLGNEEEGAVGGLPLPSSQHSNSQSVETELAEADQTQHGVDNSEVFDLLDDAIPPNMEILDNQETPPREENTEQPLQES